MEQTNFKPGDAARIRRSIHAPYTGHTGVVLQIDSTDERAPYLVMFNDGLQFRYKAEEMEPIGGSGSTIAIETMQRLVQQTRTGLWKLTHLH